MTLAQLIGWAFLVTFFVGVLPLLLASFVREMGLLKVLGVVVATFSIVAILTYLLILADSVKL